MTHFLTKFAVAVTLVAAIWLIETRAQESAAIFGLEIGDEPATAMALLDQQCESVAAIPADQPVHPLAEKSELHLVCDGYRGGPVGFGKAAFVFADGKLVQAEALEVDLESANAVLGEPDGVYLGMNNYREGTVWLDTDGERMVLLSMDALHPNLFAWSNPNLGHRVVSGSADSTLIPDVIDFSASLEDLRPQLEQACPQIVVHENERVWLPHKPEVQVQIDCFGFPFAGFERKLEVVFGDGKLEVIWVLTGKPEETRLRDLLVRDWGEPDTVNNAWEIFGDGRISLYKEKPEFLILSDDMIPLYRDMMSNP